MILSANAPKRIGRPPMPEHLKKRHMILAVCVSEDLGLRIKAEADRRDVSFGSLLKPLFVEFASSIDSQQAA